MRIPVRSTSWLCAALLATGGVEPASAEQADREPMETVTVIGVTPVRGTGLPAERIPSHVQHATSEELQRQRSLDLSEFLNRNLGSVFVNEAQNNPLQPDVQFRGFVASPLLGLPQGISVYQDGVRINEPFGDTVNWALVPEQAIASIDLIPGANPLYGLNTLGGALSVRTKDGFSHPGASVEALAGSFGRVLAQAESGGRLAEQVGYYVTAGYLEEDGWRDFSPSDAGQFFGDLTWQGRAGSLDLSLTYADTDLIGNGPTPLDLQALDREAVFTRPDITENELVLLNLRGIRRLRPGIELDGVLYWRSSDIATLNGDDSDFEECEQAPGFVCEEEEEGEEQIVLDQNGDPIPFSELLEGATVNRSRTEQDGYGGAVQLNIAGDLGGRDNRLIVGGALDESSIGFAASSELGALDGTRLAVGAGVFVGEAFTSLEADTRSYGLYFTDTLALTARLGLTLSGRYNRTEVELRDQLGTELSGDHDFDRFNPAAGLTYGISSAVQLYASYNESNRAPSPVELTCADENDPCRLPNAFLSDPPLDQVVARSIELGARGDWGPARWHLGVFHTDNEDDILFISAGPLTNEGFFDNVGETRRRGAELDLRGGAAEERLGWFLHYTYLEATFEERFSVTSPNNPAAVDGEIPVRPGDRIPGIPEHLLKLGVSFSLTPAFSLGGDLLYSSSRPFRGDEGNLTDSVPGYTVVNLHGEYRINDRFTVFAKVDNLFDEDYETFGLFGEPAEVLGEEFDDPRFLSPGAPLAAWVGVRLQL